MGTIICFGKILFEKVLTKEYIRSHIILIAHIFNPKLTCTIWWSSSAKARNRCAVRAALTKPPLCSRPAPWANSMQNSAREPQTPVPRAQRRDCVADARSEPYRVRISYLSNSTNNHKMSLIFISKGVKNAHLIF